MSRRWLSVGGYAVAMGTQAAAGLVSVPLLTRLLGPQEYGAWVMLEPLAGMVGQVGLLGVNHGLLKLVGEDRLKPGQAWRALLGRCLLGLMIAAFFASMWLGWKRGPLPAVALLLLAIAEGMVLLGLAALRSDNRSGAFACVLVVKGLVWVGLLVSAKLAGLPWLDRADVLLWWMLLPTLLASATAGTLLLGKGRGDGRSTVTPLGPQAYRSAVRYGLPLMGAGLLSSMIAIGDRYVMAWWLDLAAIGAYVVTVKLVGALSLLTMPLNMWFPAARFQHLRDADGGQAFFRRAALVAAVLMVACAGALWLLSPELVAWFSHGQQVASGATAWLLCGAVCTGLGGLLNVGLLQSGSTHWPLICTALAAAFQLLLLVLLVPLVGTSGAAMATGLAGVIALLLQHALSQRIYRIRHAYGGILSFALVVTLSCILLAQATANGAVRLIAYGVIVAGMVALCWRIEQRRPRSAADQG